MHRLLGILLAGALTTPVPTQSPNVLVIVADDLGVELIGAYGVGQNAPPTPNLDALATRGVLFRNAWANPTCSPTRAAIHTGRYAFRHTVGVQIEEASGVLAPEEITLPEALDRAGTGHAHALIGKWHLATKHGGRLAPNVAGWSHFAGLLGGKVNSYYLWPRVINGVQRTSVAYATTRIVNDALNWIDDQSSPWLCVVSFNAPHSPFEAPPPALHTRNLVGLNPSTTPIPFYHAMIEAMDSEIGRLLAALGPDLDRTHVVFVGDNGTPGIVIQDPYDASRSKGTPYQGGVHVPLIIAGPEVAQAGRDESALVSLVDLFATVLDLAGADTKLAVPAWVANDSISMADYVRRVGLPSTRSTVLTERFSGDNWSFVHQNGFAAIRDATHKLIRRYPYDDTQSDELYDLVQDPFENSDLLAGELTALAADRYAFLSRQLHRQRHPRASWSRLGDNSCAGSAGVPDFTIAGNPRLGSRVVAQLRNAAATAPATLLLGSSNITWGSLTLPFDLTQIGGGTGCALHNSADIALSTTTDQSGQAHVAIRTPRDVSLVGRPWFASWLITDPNAPGTLGLVASNGIAAVPGF